MERFTLAVRPAYMPPLISFLIEQIRMRVPADATGREVSFGGTAGGAAAGGGGAVASQLDASRRTVEAAARSWARAWRWRLEAQQTPSKDGAARFLLASTGGGGGGLSGFLGGGGAAPGSLPLLRAPPTRARVYFTRARRPCWQ